MKLLPISGKKLVKILNKKGFVIVGQKGSHIRMKKKTTEKMFITIVPMHSILDKGTLKAILNQTGLDKSDLKK